MPWIALSFLIMLAPTFTIRLNNKKDNGHPCIVLQVSRDASYVFPLHKMLAFGWRNTYNYYTKKDLSISILSNVFLQIEINLCEMPFWNIWTWSYQLFLSSISMMHFNNEFLNVEITTWSWYNIGFCLLIFYLRFHIYI